jgi:hypothetical protein
MMVAATVRLRCSSSRRMLMVRAWQGEPQYGGCTRQVGPPARSQQGCALTHSVCGRFGNGSLAGTRLRLCRSLPHGNGASASASVQSLSYAPPTHTHPVRPLPLLNKAPPACISLSPVPARAMIARGCCVQQSTHGLQLLRPLTIVLINLIGGAQSRVAPAPDDGLAAKPRATSSRSKYEVDGAVGGVETPTRPAMQERRPAAAILRSTGCRQLSILYAAARECRRGVASSVHRRFLFDLPLLVMSD